MYLPEGCDLSLGVIGCLGWCGGYRVLVGLYGFDDGMAILCVMILVCISVDIKIGLV